MAIQTGTMWWHHQKIAPKSLYLSDDNNHNTIACSSPPNNTVCNEKRGRNIGARKAYSHSIFILHPFFKYHRLPTIKSHILSPILPRSPYQLCLCTSCRYPQRSCFSSSVPEDVCRHRCRSTGCWTGGRRRWKRLVERGSWNRRMGI